MVSFDGPHTHAHPRESQAGGAEPGSAIAAQRLQLEAERAACERKLDQLKSDIDSNDHALAWSRSQAERDIQAKLRFLASISPDLRTPLHTMLGIAELLRREGGLNPVQSTRLNAMLEAGLRLLDRVNCVLTLSDSDGMSAAPAGAVIDGEGSAVAAADLAAGSAAAGLRVLVVDDIAMNRDIAAAFLTSAGHHVTIAEDGPQAVLAVSGGDFDVVLMDVRMPGMDGLEATRQIRGLGRGRGQVPIVALTALAFVEQVADCRSAGMNGHLAKPFSPETLCRAIALAAAGQQAGSQVRTGTPTPPVVSLAAFRRGAGVQGNPAAGQVQVQGWLDIASPWSRPASAAALAGPEAHRRRADDAGFMLKMASVASKCGRRLVDGKLCCEPPPDDTLTEFHWLLFAQAGPEGQRGFSAACDLWRWNGTSWRSVTVPGAQFSADEMYDQGWRYCGPCAGKMANVEILAGGIASGGVRGEARPAP